MILNSYSNVQNNNTSPCTVLLLCKQLEIIETWYLDISDISNLFSFHTSNYNNYPSLLYLPNVCPFHHKYEASYTKNHKISLHQNNGDNPTYLI